MGRNWQVRLFALLYIEFHYFTKTSTVVHGFNGHEVNGIHGFNGKKCYDGAFYVVNNGKIDA